MKKLIFAIILFGLALFAGGCGNKDEVHPPQAVQAGVDRCEHCNMLVPDDHNATQLVLNDGRSLKFDDLGCMVEWVNEHGLENVNVRYVRDFTSSEWIKIEDAIFVYDKQFRTPMAYGVYSFSSSADAEAFVLEQGKGKILAYLDLEAHSWERDMELMKQMKEEMGDHGHGHGDADEEHEDEHEEENSHGHGEKKKDH